MVMNARGFVEDEAAPAAGWRRIWRKAESTISALFAFVFAFAALFVALALYVEAEKHPDAWWPLAVVLVVLVIEGMFLLWLKHALEAGHHPIAPWVALNQPRWPWPMRPLVAAWALGHAVVAGGAALSLIVASYEAMSGVVAWFRVLAAIGQFSAIYCSNLYLVMAIGAVWRSPRAIDLLWRYRAVISLLLSLLAWWLHQLYSLAAS